MSSDNESSYQRQAEIKRRTRSRIVQAALSLFEEKWIDEITLNEIAERAEVTLQTVIRHFGGREGILEAISLPAMGEFISGKQGGDVLPTVYEVDEVVPTIGRIYEQERNGRLMKQEERYPALKRLAEAGRRLHEEWIRRCFAVQLEGLDVAPRERVVRKLLHLTDFYSWHLYRNVYGLDREETERTLTEMVRLVLDAPRP